MNDNGIDHKLRARTLTMMRIADRVILFKVTMYAFVALVYLELSWARAINWWCEIGCSVHSLPALFVQSLSAGNLDDFSVAKVALAMLIAAMIVLTDKMETRR